MKYVVIVLAFWYLRANAQTGLEILKNSNDKIRSLKAISYNIYSENAYEKITADVVIKRGNDLPIFETGMLKVSGLAIGSSGSKQLTFAYNGSSFDFMDPDTHEMVQLDSPSYNKVGRTRLMNYTLLAMPCYWQKEPIVLKDITADKMEDTTIFNQLCFKVRIQREVNNDIIGKQKFESYWFVGKKDLLVHGYRTSSGIQLLNIKAIDQEIDKNFFILASIQDVKKMNGLEPISTGLLTIGTKAPEWSLPSASQAISLKSLQGKVVLLDFWGTWCVPCIKAMPDIQAIYDHFKNENVIVIGVSVETEKAADPLTFVTRKGYTYPIALNGNTITKAYNVQEFPTVYLIDKKGNIIHAEHGGARENFKEDMISKIEYALKEK